MTGFWTIGNYQSINHAVNEMYFKTMAATAFSTSHFLLQFRKFEE